MKKTFFIVGIILLMGWTNTSACTTFSLSNSEKIVFGRNFDFYIGEGFLAVNSRGLKKKALLPDGENPAVWVADYGSITFNQIALDFPMGGMNEKGLVVAQMLEREAVYPKKDKRKAVSELQWIQYQLDKSATTEDVLESLKKIRISQRSIYPLHFLVSDADGTSATVEFLDGEAVVHKGNSLNNPVLGNLPYSTGNKLINNYKPFGGEQPIPAKANNAVENIALASARVDEFQKSPIGNIIDYGFGILKAVNSPDMTQWSAVFDITEKEIHFRTLKKQEIRTLKLRNFDFTCSGTRAYLYLDDNQSLTQLHEQFENYSPAWHKNHVMKVNKLYNSTLKNFPAINEEMAKEQSLYPETVKCVER